MIRKFLCLMPLLLATPAWGWGSEGHEIVAAIAARELTPAASRQVARLLGGDAAAMMIHDSNWADEIRSDRPETGRWHFVDIPLDSGGYDAARDCPGGDCVVARIAQDRQILANAKLPPPQRAEALMFLIHFVADIHQPLHTVDDGDRGGNDIRAWADGRRTNMHHVWDMNVVEPLGPDASAVAAAILAGLSPQQIRAWQSGTPAAWANESFHLAQTDVYAFVRGRHTVRVPDAYLEREEPAVRTQLARAGARLAWILNTTLK